MLAYAASLFIEDTKLCIKPEECVSELVSTIKDILNSDLTTTTLPMVLGMLTGCRNFKPVYELKHLNGSLSHRKAVKLEILSMWKYLLNQK